MSDSILGLKSWPRNCKNVSLVILKVRVKPMDFRWLEDALILIEERNLSRAAARRNVTQPAFSRRIRALEDWVGIDP